MLKTEADFRELALICSGGLDSVCLAYRLAAQNKLALIISFDYGQRHKKELKYAKQCAENLNIPFILSDITSILSDLKGSALTDYSVAVPNGHYAEENMKLTVVPNRNALFMSIAFTIAAAHKADGVALAAHSGDHFIYPDCRPDFLRQFDKMEELSLEGAVQLCAPYAEKTKADIVCDGAIYRAPFDQTWSCYKGDALHCGRCGTCVERREAFYKAGIEDPTEYADADYWKIAVKKYKERKV